MSKSYRIGLFSSLYFAQGMLMSYFLTFNILYLGDAGYSPAEVGIFQAILVLPFVLKILLGMLSDGVNLFGLGHRKPYIALGLIGQIAAMIVAPNISVENGLGTFALVSLIASISMALYDTCTDGMALDTTPEDERGIIQGAMVGARAAGILVMLVLGGMIAEKIGWRYVFYSISLISVIPFITLITSGLKERSDEVGNRTPFDWRAFKSFRSGPVLLLVAMGFVYSIALDGVLTFLSDYLREVLEISLGNIGMLVAFSMVGRILGAVSNSWVTDRIGYKQSLYVAIGLTTVGCLGLSMQLGVGWIGVFGFIFGLAYGYYNAVYAAMAMKMSNAAIAASMFAIFMMFINLGTVGGQVIGGVVTEKFGFSVMVIVFGVFNLLNILLTNLIFKKESKLIPVEG
ncbi:MFS transporter [bacterium]|nr:MFS transporter [bacterium]